MNEKMILQIQRLIDGECNQAEIRDLLGVADQQPEQWKAIATAFVEDQIWRQQFQSMESIPSPASSAKAHPAEAEHSDPLVKYDQRGQSSDLSAGKLFRLNGFGLAACVLLAAMMGYVTGQRNLQNFVPVVDAVANNSATVSPGPDTSSSSNPRITPASLKADHHLQLVDGQGDDRETILDGEIPLYAIDSPEQLAQIQQPGAEDFPISPDLLKQLTGRGFRFRQDLNYISGNLKDGRQFVVPVRTINFTPGQ
jgi:hypothetical protein